MREELRFKGATPVAVNGLGSMVRDHFANGRIFATVGAHGGLLRINYWGKQHLGAAEFFHGDAESAWVKLMRVRVRIGGECFYPELRDTRLYPFGLSSECAAGGVGFTYELLLLPDALVQRVEVTKNPRKLSVKLEMLHQESCTASSKANREWADFAPEAPLKALTVSCVDVKSAKPVGDIGIAQVGFNIGGADTGSVKTWIAISCDGALESKRGYHPRSKYYLGRREPVKDKAAIFTVFATSRKDLEERLSELRRTAHKECDALLARYESSLKARPTVRTGNDILDSAFKQYPEVIQSMKLPDMPGATRATQAGYFVWGWDGMTPTISSALSNEPEYIADILRFMWRASAPKIGIPHAFTSTFKPAMKAPLPAQAQFICGLYHHIAATGSLSLAKSLLPACETILELCRAKEIKGSGLVEDYALWPDFPEAMEEDTRDISSMNNSLLYQGLRVMEYVYASLSDNKKAEDCRGWAARLRESFRKHLFDEKKGFFISSCSSVDFKPRRHYCCQSVFWLTPFARELVSHAPRRIARFMDEHLRSPKCLLSLPHWDTAWMADGNQLGSSFPAADHFYLNIHKLAGDPTALEAWMGDVEWFWRRHTAPEAFTPEGENEDALGPDNPGCKQLQAVTTWGTPGRSPDSQGWTSTTRG